MACAVHGCDAPAGRADPHYPEECNRHVCRAHYRGRVGNGRTA